VILALDFYTRITGNGRKNILFLIRKKLKKRKTGLEC